MLFAVDTEVTIKSLKIEMLFLASKSDYSKIVFVSFLFENAPNYLVLTSWLHSSFSLLVNFLNIIFSRWIMSITSPDGLLVINF